MVKVELEGNLLNPTRGIYKIDGVWSIQWLFLDKGQAGAFVVVMFYSLIWWPEFLCDKREGNVVFPDDLIRVEGMPRSCRS